MLDKYDEEIEGEKLKYFRLDVAGHVDSHGDADSEMEKIRSTLKAQQMSLEMAAPQLARDYYTEEELVKFKKPRKKVRKVVRKRQTLKADDLLTMTVDSAQDRGSRNIKSILKNKDNQNIGEAMDIETLPAVPVDELDLYVATNDESSMKDIIDDDEAENELQLALERSRRQKRFKQESDDDPSMVVQKLAHSVLAKPQKSEPKSKRKSKGTIILNSTSEFCRTLGDIPTLNPNPVPVVPELEEEEKVDEAVQIIIDEPVNPVGTWEEVDEEKTTTATVNEEVEDENVLEAEPLPSGMAATLNLATMKGYLTSGVKPKFKFDPLNLPETKSEVDVEKMRDEEKNRYSSRGYERDRDRYDPHSFKDKSNYKPNIKLEYVDDKGRPLNKKEAFRLLSHRFHGKGSGKIKTEKRAKKLQEDKKLQMMSSIDTPLNTSALFKDKQEKTQSAYLVLSGGGKNLLSGESLQK